MAKDDVQLVGFNRGEVSRTALARVDIDRLRMSAEIQINWLPYVVGPMMLRPGLGYLGRTKGDAKAKFLPFIFAKADTALLEFTNQALRVWIADVLLARVAVATTIQNGTFASATGWTTSNTTSGASVTIGAGTMVLACPPIGGLAQAQQSISIAAGDIGKEHGLRIVITTGPVAFRAGSSAGLTDLIAQTTLDEGTHSLTFTPTGGTVVIQIESTDPQNKTLTQCSIEAAGVVELPTVFETPDLGNIRFDYAGDIVFLACYGKQQYKVERRATGAWSIVVYKSNDGPFAAIAGAVNVNMTPSVYYGNGTLSSDQPYFNSNHIGALFRIFTNGQINQTILGAVNAVTPSARVTGVGASRDFTVATTGTWAGTLALEESFDGPDSGFVEIATVTANGSPTFTRNTGGSTRTPNLDNIVAWYRVKFKLYTSGTVQVNFSYTGGGGYGTCRVTGFTDSKNVSIEVVKAFTSLQASTVWVEGEWSNNGSFPTTVCFHDGRLWWFGGDKIWGSVSDGIYSFDPEVVGDAGPINRSFGSGSVDVANWAVSLLRLVVGREMSEASVRSSSFDVPITPTNFSAKPCSTQGSARIPALKVDQRVIFVQQSNRRVYALQYNLQAGDYMPRDKTRLNLDIGLPGFVATAVARQPDTNLFFVRGDGQVAVLLDDVDDEVEAWWRIKTAPTMAGDGIIEETVILPGNVEDAIYFVVARTIGGTVRRHLERMALREECRGGDMNKIADAFVSYDGPAMNTIGCPHLVGETVVVWADGAKRGEYVVPVGGTVTLDASYSKIMAGLKYKGQFKSAKLAYAAQLGTALTKPKKIQGLGVILYDTHIAGLKYGAALDDDSRPLDNLPQVEDGEAMSSDTVYSEYDKPSFSFPGEWNSDSRLCLECEAPYPAMVAALVVDLQTSG